MIRHQWLYGADVLEIYRELLRIFQAELNRLPLEHELRWAKTLKESDPNAGIDS